MVWYFWVELNEKWNNSVEEHECWEINSVIESKDSKGIKKLE